MSKPDTPTKLVKPEIVDMPCHACCEDTAHNVLATPDDSNYEYTSTCRRCGKVDHQ